MVAEGFAVCGYTEERRLGSAAERLGERRSEPCSVVEQPATGPSVVWMEKVSPEQYNAPLRNARPAAATNEPTAAQRIMGDIAPTLADLTDRVLFGEVWARPQLSQRDRSLVTVSALIAMNRPDQLRSHLARARDNGVTQEELIMSASVTQTSSRRATTPRRPE